MCDDVGKPSGSIGPMKKDVDNPRRPLAYKGPERDSMNDTIITDEIGAARETSPAKSNTDAPGLLARYKFSPIRFINVRAGDEWHLRIECDITSDRDGFIRVAFGQGPSRRVEADKAAGVTFVRSVIETIRDIDSRIEVADILEKLRERCDGLNTAAPSVAGLLWAIDAAKAALTVINTFASDGPDDFDDQEPEDFDDDAKAGGEITEHPDRIGEIMASIEALRGWGEGLSRKVDTALERMTALMGHVPTGDEKAIDAPAQAMKYLPSGCITVPDKYGDRIMVRPDGEWLWLWGAHAAARMGAPHGVLRSAPAVSNLEIHLSNLTAIECGLIINSPQAEREGYISEIEHARGIGDVTLALKSAVEAVMSEPYQHCPGTITITASKDGRFFVEDAAPSAPAAHDNDGRIFIRYHGPPMSRGTDGASGWDLPTLDCHFRIHGGETKRVPTGVTIEIPEGYEGQVRPRSSASALGLLVHLGTIDRDYRGEIEITVTNLSGRTIDIGSRSIAQLVICPVAHARLEPVASADDLSATDRGAGGFGSTDL